MGYSCFTDDGNQAAILATNVETGDVIAVCGEHIIDYAVGLLESVTGVRWEPATGYGADPNTGDSTDEDETGDGPTTTDTPAPLDPPGGAPGPTGKDEIPSDGGDQGSAGALASPEEHDDWIEEAART